MNKPFFVLLGIFAINSMAIAVDINKKFPVIPDLSTPKTQSKSEGKLSSASLPNEHQPATTLLNSCWTDAELKSNLPESAHKILPPPDALIAKAITAEFKPRLNKSIRSVSLSCNEKVLALTFDLCESSGKKSGYDAEIINTLRDYQVKATFFAGGKWMLTHPEKTMQLMADPLFELGNHTWTHKNLRLVHGRELDQQILKAQAQYKTTCNK